MTRMTLQVYSLPYRDKNILARGTNPNKLVSGYSTRHNPCTCETFENMERLGLVVLEGGPKSDPECTRGSQGSQGSQGGQMGDR